MYQGVRYYDVLLSHSMYQGVRYYDVLLSLQLSLFSIKGDRDDQNE